VSVSCGTSVKSFTNTVYRMEVAPASKTVLADSPWPVSYWLTNSYGLALCESNSALLTVSVTPPNMLGLLAFDTVTNITGGPSNTTTTNSLLLLDPAVTNFASRLYRAVWRP
jgi:hypothetical protein